MILSYKRIYHNDDANNKCEKVDKITDENHAIQEKELENKSPFTTNQVKTQVEQPSKKFGCTKCCRSYQHQATLVRHQRYECILCSVYLNGNEMEYMLERSKNWETAGQHHS